MLVSYIDSTVIATFIEWEYVKYEKDTFDLWIKSCWDKGPYTQAYHDCRYSFVLRKSFDSSTISISSLDNFKKDFPFDLNLDTSIYYGLIFSKNQSNKLDIYTNTRQLEGHSFVQLESNLDISEVFKKRNPFEKLNTLDSLKNILGIYRTYFRPEVGNYLQFYLTEKDILTYFPTHLKLTPFFRVHWEKVFHQGLKINENWYLRRTDLPDN
jgi:hypothetical protein